MKKRKNPIIKSSLENFNGPFKYIEDLSVEYVELTNENIINLNHERIVFDTVIFNHCHISDNILIRSQFIDCQFNHCIFTNNRFEESTFMRCVWKGSKLDGTHFINSHLEHILINSSTGRYLDIADSVMKIIEINHTNLNESSWFQNKIDQLIFDDVSLIKADVYETSLKDVDLSSTKIETLRIDLKDIKGAIISNEQAPLLCNLIGVQIKE